MWNQEELATRRHADGGGAMDICRNTLFGADRPSTSAWRTGPSRFGPTLCMYVCIRAKYGASHTARNTAAHGKPPDETTTTPHYDREEQEEADEACFVDSNGVPVTSPPRSCTPYIPCRETHAPSPCMYNKQAVYLASSFTVRVAA